MEKSTPLGLVLGFVLIFGTIFMGQGWGTFFDVPSFVIVFGGTVAAMMVGSSFAVVKRFPAQLKGVFGFQPPDFRALVVQFVDLARLVRRDGLLALDRKLADVEDALARFGLEMAVDGVEEAEVDDLLQTRMDEALAERRGFVALCNAAGTYAPAFGMVGTLIGLIQMLQNLSDPDAIGPAMAVAMITTFYGAVLANLVFLPLAGKQKEQVAALAKAQEIVRAGVLGILRGESPPRQRPPDGPRRLAAPRPPPHGPPPPRPR